MKHNDPSSEQSLWNLLDRITESIKSKRLADVFRFKSFRPFETFGPHRHERIEINYVKKGSCIIRLEDESVGFKENEIMIILSNEQHFFEAGPKGATLMQLEFLPDIFSRFDLEEQGALTKLTAVTVFSEKNRLIKIVNNVRIMRAVQRIVNELDDKNKYYHYLVIMYYAELLILIYRHMDETWLPICSNEFIKKAIAHIRANYREDISIADVAGWAGIGERYLRKLFARHLNLSPVDFLNQIRLNKAIELLRNTEMSVKEVCFACGFKSPQYFSIVFKQQMGITPRELTK
ncbi:MAG: AraC family transcriptional regulator [Tannerella sp.]|jgi:AraC-like DNA-binding protein|nr:AraC family transcriptional regulator [Tannerella sp.]